MDRKKVLIIEDDDKLLNIYSELLASKSLSEEYEGTYLNHHKEEATKYKDVEFDLIICDGLEGRCFDMLGSVNAKRKVILRGSKDIVDEAQKKGIEVYLKGESLIRIITGQDVIEYLAQREQEQREQQEA